jgi:hypothetical protein
MGGHPGRGLRRLALWFLLLTGSLQAAAAENSEVWLVTYGPGEIYWQRFGHNAIWIRDPQRGLDHVFNFGFFDFGQQDFLTRFLQGRMLYFSAARPAREEFADYIDENRSIRAQRLALDPARGDMLREYLLAEVRPENRDYLYDYYLNNCSTRVRDALDLALEGQLSSTLGAEDAEWSWRDHTRRLSAPDFWLYLGLEIGLGPAVDAPISRWDEMFIPELLAAAVALESVGADGRSKPLVVEDAVLYQSTLTLPPAAPQSWWPRYLLASLAVVAVVALLSRLVWTGLARLLARGWFLVAGLGGLTLLFLWLFTDHAATRLNLNVLVLNPLWLWLAFGPGGSKRPLQIVVVFSVLALILPFVPPFQYSLDVLAALLPLNLAAAASLAGSRPPHRSSGSRSGQAVNSVSRSA